MADRQDLINRFLAREGWGAARRTALTADASFRQYHRLNDKGRHAMLMDAPPPQENIAPFLTIARHLTGLGYSAPEIFAEDRDAGLILLEDFGDSTFTRLLAAGEKETPLYLLATDLLIDLHSKPAAVAIPPNLQSYDIDKLLTEVSLLTDWFIPAAIGKALSSAAQKDYQARWRDILADVKEMPETLVLRDYHVDNLMRLDDRDNIAACGLLDFQDAVVGPVTYDLVSLIEDARRDVSPETIAAVKTRYIAAFPQLDPEAFLKSMAMLGAQRHAKVIGIFTRLCVRDGKPIYLDHIPRVWRLFEAACQHPCLTPIREWLSDHVPVGARGIPTGLRTS